MESNETRKPKTAGHPIRLCKPYVAPGLERLSPAAARELLLRTADAGDPEVQHVLDYVDELQGDKGS
jgi:hypothetical protein